MRIINANNKIPNSCTTTKTPFVLDKYADATTKTINKRLLKIEIITKNIIKNEQKLKQFLKLINNDLNKNIGLSMNKIIDKAKKY